MENPVIIFGANYLGRQAKDILERNGNVVYGFLDDNKKIHNTLLDEVTVLGSTDDDGFLKLIGKKCDAVVAADETKFRKSLVSMLLEELKTQPVNVISQTSRMSTTSSLGHGNIVDDNVTIGAGTSVGSYCILYAGANIAPEVKIADYVQVGAGSIINTGCDIEEDAYVGSGVVIVAGVSVGKGARIGAGSVVIGPVKAGETVFGNPAQPIKS
ncbi:MAG: acetyltransferase [Chryseolinea sp.]